jgi:hypothetical protein
MDSNNLIDELMQNGPAPVRVRIAGLEYHIETVFFEDGHFIIETASAPLDVE